MSFNTGAFVKQAFEPRTEDVTLDALADWSEGEPVFKVRGLTAVELGRANEAVASYGSIKSIIDALQQANRMNDVSAIKEAMGFSDKTPVEVARKLEHLVAGCVEPKINMDVAIKLSRTFPVEFAILTNKIAELTGLGSIAVKKPSPSGKRQVSKKA